MNKSFRGIIFASQKLVGGTGLEPVKPFGCKPNALPTELTAQEFCFAKFTNDFSNYTLYNTICQSVSIISLLYSNYVHILSVQAGDIFPHRKQ